ncbi:hypothetical protein M422DRAFT_189470 [Sphaerobolus stellatus SS14]|uniref:Fe2OG dioxygenase domain-containing protein n=1 Tax=Sphaerobolus stellatus (strain SS14) TaxID=990650 RepID=A0A0C9UTW4_SPHS4|nr:hypothetical protein M422DRAFT_189470 [Sphaerobolus stellatus SS14]
MDEPADSAIYENCPVVSEESIASLAIFDPDVHLAPCAEPPSCIDMDELGLGSVGISKVAVSKPFPLFTLEGVRRIREELFKHETLANHIFSDTLNPSTVRGMCLDRTSFIKEAWTHPEVKRRINEAAGVELDIIFDYEIGHTYVGSKEEIQPTLMVSPNWHKDSYPFVCILMLCESSHLEGGRTVIEKSDGSQFFADLPPIGHAMVLQGGYILHAVSPTDKMQERISMVTSYRPSDPLKEDISVLRTVRTMSDVRELHRQWCQYRLKVLARRAEVLAAKLDDPAFDGRIEDEMAKFMIDQGEYMAHTWGEMIRPVASVKTNLRETYLAWKAKDMEAEESASSSEDELESPIDARISAQVAEGQKPEEVTVEAVPNIAVFG